MRRTLMACALVLGAAAGSLAPTASADPCGMVPPIFIGDTPPLTRINAQRTYVFYKDGYESIVLRPDFRGQVEHFGMLIPFPTPPALRKMPDDVFDHIAKSIDPPQVQITVQRNRGMFLGAPSASLRAGAQEMVAYDQGLEVVNVIREEAVGMYQVAVLEAGSAKALERWMTDNGYQYPKGMDRPVNDYVAEGWCFVAVKTKVGTKKGVDPKPGMRQANRGLPSGAGFEGNVQAMGFRFKTDRLIVPMRLSAFNPGKLRNIVYLLTDSPKRIDVIDSAMVRRQLSGAELHRNVTELLPISVVGGTLADITAQQIANVRGMRDPAPKNGKARDLFASDLMAVASGRLSNPAEEVEKELLAIGEELGLRGEELDALHAGELAEMQAELNEQALDALRGMTMTVVDGDFPRAYLAEKNLTFSDFVMSSSGNDRISYNAAQMGPGGPDTGRVYFQDELSSPINLARFPRWAQFGLLMAVLGAFLAWVFVLRRRG